MHRKLAKNRGPRSDCISARFSDQRKPLWERTNSVQKINCRKVLARIPSLSLSLSRSTNAKERRNKEKEREILRASWESERKLNRGRRDGENRKTDGVGRGQRATKGGWERNEPRKKKKRDEQETKIERRSLLRNLPERRSKFSSIYTKALDILKHEGHEEARSLSLSVPLPLLYVRAWYCRVLSHSLVLCPSSSLSLPLWMFWHTHTLARFSGTFVYAWHLAWRNRRARISGA